MPPISRAGSTAYDALIAHHAKLHGVPESLVHRTVMRESGYNPGLVHRHCYGLMQIKYATARSMGYNGPERGLLDPQVNLTYAIPYLANAYRLADGNEDRATALYRGGYYYFAKHKKMLGALRTASASPVTPEPPAPAPVPQPPRNPLAGLSRCLPGRRRPMQPMVHKRLANDSSFMRGAHGKGKKAARRTPSLY